MTPDEIKVEFARHPADAPVMKAFRAWLEIMREDAEGGVCAGEVCEHRHHMNTGKLAQAKYALGIFDGVLEEAEKARQKADATKH